MQLILQAYHQQQKSLYWVVNSRWPLFWGKYNQGLFKDFQAPSHPSSKPIPPQFLACYCIHSFYSIKSVSNTDVHYTVLQWLHHFSHNGDYYFGIQAFSRTSFAKFQNFQAPNPLSKTFQDLEKRKKNFRTFKEEWPPWGQNLLWPPPILTTVAKSVPASLTANSK